MNDDMRSLLRFFIERRSRVVGLLIGVISGLIAVFCGFGRALAFAFCVLVGYGLGRLFEYEDSIASILTLRRMRRRH